MRLNHINLVVSDLDEARVFFETCFEMRLVTQKAEAVAVLSDEGGFVLVLSSLAAFRQAAQPYPNLFHVGFLQTTRDEVDSAFARIRAAGVALENAPRAIRDGYGFYFHALDGIQFEVSCPA